MHPQMQGLRCSIVRGGTSKGIFIMRNELPRDPALRDKMLLAIFGSPDVRQIDGLGGADVLTSKLAIIGPSTRPDADVDYTFGQVSFERAFIDYGGNCGNISSAVGGFAIDAGLVEPVEPITRVRIHLTNSHQLLVAEVPVRDGKAAVEGAFAIDGVPGTGAEIVTDWSGTTGSVTGKLLPTGNPQDMLTVDGVEYTVSLVDLANPLVFVKASALGLRGTESPVEIESNREMMARIEKIRGVAAVRFGLVDQPERATTETPYIPFFAIVSPAAEYTGLNGVHARAGDMDFTSRLLFMLKMHKAYPITGTVCTGAAARIPGSVVWEVMRQPESTAPVVRIGHPGGIVRVEVRAERKAGALAITRVTASRTARKIMDGTVYIRNSVCA